MLNWIAGAAERRRRDHNENAWLAWHIAHHTAYAPKKPADFIRLERMLDRGDKAPTPQSPAQQLDMARAWVGSFGSKG